LPSYSYENSVKSDKSDERINVYLQRPIAGLIVRAVYLTSISPNHLTLVSIIFGVIGGVLVALSDARLAAAGLCFYLKDVFDSADGQLARAKQQFSRRGRFLDSIGDFIVDLCLFGGICVFLYRSGTSIPISLSIGAVGFLGTSLRVSYHVFYQTSYLHREQKYQTNRISEELRYQDYLEDRTTLWLQRIFLFLYGWQDRLMLWLDVWCLRGGNREHGTMPATWYQDAIALRLSGLLGFGTEYVVLTACLLLGSVSTYLFFTLIFFNGVWLCAVLYRKFFLSRNRSMGNSVEDA
jgi:phosphatidylglycerophosphate synthase